MSASPEEDQEVITVNDQRYGVRVTDGSPEQNLQAVMGMQVQLISHLNGPMHSGAFSFKITGFLHSLRHNYWMIKVGDSSIYFSSKRVSQVLLLLPPVIILKPPSILERITGGW